MTRPVEVVARNWFEPTADQHAATDRDRAWVCACVACNAARIVGYEPPRPPPAVVLLDETIELRGGVWRVEAQVKLLAGGDAEIDITGAVGPHCIFWLGAAAWGRWGRVDSEIVREKLIAAAREIVRRGALRRIP